MSIDATISPVVGENSCDEDGCDDTELLARIDPDTADADARVLCPTHRVEFLREVSDA
jgi:hypothetical protein